MKRTSLSQIQLLISLILHSKPRKARFANFHPAKHQKAYTLTAITKVL